METYLEVLLELVFCTKPPNFGVEAYMEVPTGVALKSVKLRQSHRFTFHPSRAFTRPAPSPHGSSTPILRIPHAAPSDPPSPHDPRSPLLPPSPPPPTH
jgi:hypothetical protein